MEEELNNPLFSRGNVSDEMLLKYLNGELDHNESYEVEKALLDSDLLNDASEGLQLLESRKKLPKIKSEIESRLSKQLKIKKEKKQKREIKDLPWLYIYIIIILVLIFISYAVVRAFL
ncbi:MAG: hypothetical protein J0H55_11675 [Chitinophagaceae bacterium]|nr:hypothetical protein [Chitinophagaceae bacterium]